MAPTECTARASTSYLDSLIASFPGGLGQLTEVSAMPRIRMVKTRTAISLALALSFLSACGGSSSDGSTPVAVTPAATSAAVSNHVPTIAGSPAGSVTVGDAYLFQPAASDADGDALTFTVIGLPGWATLDALTGRLSGSPSDTDVGQSADIVLSVSDGPASAALPTFRIQIAARAAAPVPAPAPAPAVNATPTISGTAVKTVVAGTAYAFTPVANDPDTLSLTFSIANKPAWASFSSVTGQLSGTPTRAQVGSYTGIAISVSDGNTSASLPAFSVQVQAPPNTAPTISGIPASTVTVGAAYSFTPVAADVDQQTLGFTISNKPSWASFSTATGTLSGTPASANVGSFAGIVISVTDGTATTALPGFTLTVQAAPNKAPVIAGTPGSSVVAGTAYRFQPTASDPDGNPLTFSISGQPTWASFDTATGTLSGTPTSAQAGSYANIVITVSDSKLTASLPAFGITVNTVVLGSATLSWTPPTQNTDGSALANLAGYRIYYGSSATSLTHTVQITNPGLTSYVLGNLASGTYYFALAAYNSAGAESALSNIGSKAIP